MGLLDNVTAAVNRSTESAGRAAEKLKLKNQINEINKRRQALAAQLGASLYDITKDIPELRAGREALYDGIAACDAERADAQAKIEELDAMQQAATTAATTFKCAVCGASMNGGDLFCSGCGTPAAQAQPATSVAAVAGGPTCPTCNAPINEGDLFCMSCGNKIEAAGESVVETEEVVVETAPVPAPGMNYTGVDEGPRLTQSMQGGGVQ